MKKIFERNKDLIITVVIFLILLAFSTFVNNIKWNNGHCSNCGERWELVDVERSYKRFFANYYYECENCGKTIEIMK